MNPGTLRTSRPNKSTTSTQESQWSAIRPSCLKQSPCQFIGSCFLVVKKLLQHLKKNSPMRSKCSLVAKNPQPLPARIPPPVHPKENDTGTISFIYPKQMNQRNIKALAAVCEYNISMHFHPCCKILRILSCLMFSKWSHSMIQHALYRCMCCTHRKMNDTRVYNLYTMLGMFHLTYLYNTLWLCIPYIVQNNQSSNVIDHHHYQ